MQAFEDTVKIAGHACKEPIDVDLGLSWGDLHAPDCEFHAMTGTVKLYISQVEVADGVANSTEGNAAAEIGQAGAARTYRNSAGRAHRAYR